MRLTPRPRLLLPGAVIALLLSLALVLPSMSYFQYVEQRASISPLGSNGAEPARPAPTATVVALEAPVLPASDGTVLVSLRAAQRFAWPASGPLTSYFGPGHPLGIDIGLEHDPIAPISAAASGTVTFAGGNPCCEYGYYVTIEHDSGFVTLYGHFSRLLVTTGQKVTQGQVIGYGGATGNASGKHLHFEVARDGLLVDPLYYLARSGPNSGNVSQDGIDCGTKALTLESASISKLTFTGASLDGFALTDAVVRPVSIGSRSEAVSVAHKDGAITLEVQPRWITPTRGDEERLTAVFTKGEERREIECALVLTAPFKSPANEILVQATPRAGATAVLASHGGTSSSPLQGATATPPAAAAVVSDDGLVMPTATATPQPSNTPPPATSTAVPATATSTAVAATPTIPSAAAPTNTPAPATNTPLAPTNTAAPPTATPVPPTKTPVPPIATPTRTPTRVP